MNESMNQSINTPIRKQPLTESDQWLRIN